MDSKLRTLERLAQTGDAQAALRLAHELKRLLNDNWQAIPCAEPWGTSHSSCRLCDGKEWVRVNISELEEHIPAHTRRELDLR